MNIYKRTPATEIAEVSVTTFFCYVGPYVSWNQYDLSKRTDLYLELDYARASGAIASSTLASNNVGGTIGIRHQF